MFLYADEDFALPVVAALRQRGHDVLRAQDDGRSGFQDSLILARAHEQGRVVLTCNRRHFERLHRQGHTHSGIISCKSIDDFASLATRIDVVLSTVTPGRWCLRINRSR